jgi:hypothetical protein
MADDLVSVLFLNVRLVFYLGDGDDLFLAFDDRVGFDRV